MVDLTTSVTTALGNVLSASDGSIDELNAINHVLLTGEGIEQIIEAFAEENPEFSKALKENKDTLKKPDVELSELMGETLELSPEVAKKLGLSNKATIGEVVQNAQTLFDKILKGNNQNTFGLGNLNSETIDLLCLLLCQDSKSQIISTLKETLKSKIHERTELSAQYLQKTAEMAIEQKDAADAAEDAKKLSIFSSIASVVLAAIMTVVSAVITIGTCGVGSPAIIAASISVGLSLASLCFTGAASGCTIGAICSDDPDQKKVLNDLALAFGICSAVLGLASGGADIVGSILSNAAKVGAFAAGAAAKAVGTTVAKETAKAAGKAAAEAAESVIKNAAKETAEKTLEKVVKNASKSAAMKVLREAGEEIAEGAVEEIADATAEAVAKTVTKSLVKRLIRTDFAKKLNILENIMTTGNALIQGSLSIASGVLNIKSAKIQREMDDIKIEMAKLDQEIETLVAFIDALTQNVQKFMEDFLKNEQEAVDTLHAKNDTEQQLAQKLA